MIVSQIASRYSKALFQLAKSEDQLIRWDKDLAALSELLEKNPKLREVLESPLVSSEEKNRTLSRIAQEKFDPQLMHFLSLLLEKGRFNYLPEMIKDYSKRVREKLDALLVRVVVPDYLDDETKEKLKNKLEKTYHKKIEFRVEVDPKMIGGLILIIGNQMLDFSIRGRLQRLKEALLAG
jgi:F-type H+-transporting ATPase subunit delta